VPQPSWPCGNGGRVGFTDRDAEGVDELSLQEGLGEVRSSVQEHTECVPPAYSEARASAGCRWIRKSGRETAFCPCAPETPSSTRSLGRSTASKPPFPLPAGRYLDMVCRSARIRRA
jgi:hypothetical protein